MTAVLSPERVGRITGSRVAGILGISAYGTTREDVMREMVRDYFGDESEFDAEFVTQYGQEHEDEALDLYEFVKQVTVTRRGDQQQFVPHPDVDWAGATPDGLVGDEGFVEAKCPKRASYSSIEQRPDYFGQVQFQGACLQRAWGDFTIWRPGGLIPPERVEIDPAWWDAHVGQFEDFIGEFREIVADLELAAPYRKPLVDVRTDEQFLTAAAFYREAKSLANWAEQAMAEQKDLLVALAGDERSSRGGGVLLTRSEPKGRVDQKKVLTELAKLAHIDSDALDELNERFRGKPKGEPTWTLRDSA